MTVVGPILNEIVALQQKIKFITPLLLLFHLSNWAFVIVIISANTCTSVRKSRKVQLQQDGQLRQLDVIGQAMSKKEMFYGKLKGLHPKTETVNTDIHRIPLINYTARRYLDHHF